MYQIWRFMALPEAAGLEFDPNLYIPNVLQKALLSSPPSHQAQFY